MEREEAIKIVKSHYPANKQMLNEALEFLIPELKESEDEKIRKAIISVFTGKSSFTSKEEANKYIAWLEKQKTVGEIVERCKNSWYNEGKIAGMLEGLTDDEKYQQGWHDALEKQGEKKGYTFKSIPRLLDMIKPSETAKLYCQKLIDSLTKEGYDDDAKIVANRLSQMNGEEVAMATMDDGEKQRKELDPELKESEGENIRNGLIKAFKTVGKFEWGGLNVQDILIWLEKQGEQNPIINVPTREVILAIWDLVNEWKELTDGDISTEYGTQLDYIQKHWHESEYYLREKQGEKKATDKVEPKFKNGQWIVWQDKYYKVNYNGCGYELVDQNGLSTSLEYGTIEENAHIFTTQDAKPGDVLYSLDSKQPFIFKHRKPNEQAAVYCGINTYGKFFIGNTKDCVITTDKYIPADKFQRDLLFKKMQKAGYEWDAEKKELKLLISNGGDFESNNSKQKPTWSEEDEKMYRMCVDAVEYYHTSEDESVIRDWLISLKERLS